MLAASLVFPLDMLHLRPLQYWLKAHFPSHAWHLGHFHLRVTHRCIRAVALWSNSRLTSRRKVVKTDASNTGWGALFEGNPASGSRSHLDAMPAYQLPRNVGSFSGPKNLLTSLKRVPRPGPFRQHDGGSFPKSPRRRQVMHPLQDGATPPLWAHWTHLSLRAVHVLGRVNQGADMLSRGKLSDLFSGGQRYTIPLRLRRQTSLPNLFLGATRCSGPRLVHCSLICFPPGCPASCIRWVKEVRCSLLLVAPSGGIRHDSLSWFSCYWQPHDRYHWGQTYAHKWEGQFGIPGQSCWAFMFGHLTGTFTAPRECD